MYSIKYHHKDSSTEYYMYRAGDQDYSLTSGKLSMEMGKAGELNISLPITNPAIDSFECLTDEIIVLRDNVEIWRGRAVTSQQDFDLTGTLVCEGVLAYLYDTVYPPFEFHGKPIDLLKAVINNHNSFVSNDKKFTVGNITVADRNDYINRSATDYLKSIEILSSRFVESSLGGYFRVRVQGGVKYLDYLENYDNTASQNVEFGENILDLATEIEYGDAITAILPLGAKDEKTGEKLTVKSVNAGDIYVRDTGLISSRGFVAEVVEWEDVTEDSNLLTKARNYLAQASTFIQTFKIKAIDLHYADAEVEAFNLGDSVRVVSEAHGVNQYSELYKASFDLLDPSNDSYEFGITRTNNSLTGRAASSQRNIKDSISNLTVNFHKIAADYVTTDYLSANYATITQLDAEHAHIVDLQADVAQIDTALINKADIADLNAANAHITDLEANYANIHTLLSGNAGIGDLQTIHLTSQNSVIDVAVIRNLLANNITVNDLMAGDIITNKQRIISNDGSFLIDGSTQTIKDENGNVRIQIGRDANNEFTFILYDENGTGVLLDADGIHESAIADGLIKDAKIANDANIQATKLDIASLFTAMNADGSNTLYANKIWFSDTNQSLTQAYSQMSTSITNISDSVSGIETTANHAESVAEEASRNADKAIEAIAGITSLDNLTAILSNDACVVHTYYDGTGGDYQYAMTKVYAYKGDTDVTQAAAVTVYNVSAGLAGTWSPSTKTYQVTEMTALNGYVDFEVAYGITTGYLLIDTASVANNGIIMPDGKKLKINTDVARVYKRFSISKSPDGMAGTNYNLQTSVGVIRRSTDGTALAPPSITFSAIKTVGEITSEYIGKYKIEETSDLSTWVQKYYSSTTERTKTYTPTLSAKMIRCTLMNEDGTYLDSQTVTVISDADELNDDVKTAQQAIQTVTNRVGIVESSINGLSVDLEETQTELHGVAAGQLLFQTPYTVSDNIATFEAKVFKAGEEVHTEYPRGWFQWFRKTEEGTVTIGSGYSVAVDKTSMGYGGSIVGRFTTHDTGLLTLPDGNHVVMPNGDRLLIYSPPLLAFDVETNLYQDDALINKFSAIGTQFDVTLGKISAIVSDSEISQYSTGNTMSSKLSAVVQDVSGLSAQFSEMETTQEGTISRVTQLETNVDGLSSSVVYTNDYTGETIASLINQSASTVTINASHINLTAKNVADIVNGGDSTIQEAKIALTGSNLVDKINASTAIIQANRINLTGYVTMTNLQTAGQTVINGGNITTGYLSANRIQGGTLKLGGASNGNGILEVYNASDTLVGRMNNTGLYAIDATINGTIKMIQPGDKTGAYVYGELGSFNVNDPYKKTVITTQRGLKLYGVGNTYDSTIYIYPATQYRNMTAIGTTGTLILYSNSEKAGSSASVSVTSLNHVELEAFSSATNKGCMVDIGTGSINVYSESAPNAMSSNTGSFNATTGNLTIKGTVYAGSKSNIVETDNYGTRILGAYETPSPLYGDVGSGITDEEGYCYIEIDDIFREVSRTDLTYYVILQKQGEGDLWVEEKSPFYFVVKGTANLRFDWEIKVRQLININDRLEDYDIKIAEPSDEEDILIKEVVEVYKSELDTLIKEQEEILYEAA